MKTPSMLDRPGGHSFSRWADFSRREKAHACWLALRARWNVDFEQAASFDTDNGTVLVELQPGNPRGACTWSICTKTAAETLEAIERAFGPEARARAEAVIA